ncbi:hypothetical protein L1049_012933 [Liquidambar formosana]|uniref:F-box domain-containing protein n=1 Tax=Liquidambar formosana TaxID=63359 RepID=A0AAP0RKB7_LIQFO
MVIMAGRKRMIKTRLITCSKRRKRKQDIPHLPKEIIFNILSRLPAGFLHEKGKYVCKTWANIIRDRLFITTHLLHSNAGLFIQNWCRPDDARYLEIEGRMFKMTSLKGHFPGVMLASCEGISLFLRKDPHEMLYVSNNVTMKVAKLPCPPPAIGESFLYRSGITRISHTGAFKVICPYVALDG